MALWDSLKSAAKATVSVAKLPVALGADLVTMGGMLTDRDESYTEQTAKNATEQ